MDKLRISIVEFLNTAPLVWGFTDGPLAGKYDLSFAVPSQCAEDVRAGLQGGGEKRKVGGGGGDGGRGAVEIAVESQGHAALRRVSVCDIEVVQRDDNAARRHFKDRAAPIRPAANLSAVQVSVPPLRQQAGIDRATPVVGTVEIEEVGIGLRLQHRTGGQGQTTQ